MLYEAVVPEQLEFGKQLEKEEPRSRTKTVEASERGYEDLRGSCEGVKTKRGSTQFRGMWRSLSNL